MKHAFLTAIYTLALTACVMAAMPEASYAQGYVGEENNKDLSNEVGKVRETLKKNSTAAQKEQQTSILSEGQDHLDRLARAHVAKFYFEVVADGTPRIALMVGQIEPNVLEHMIDDYVYSNHDKHDYIDDKTLTAIIAKNKQNWNLPGAAAARAINANSSLYLTSMPEGRAPGELLYVHNGKVNSTEAQPK